MINNKLLVKISNLEEIKEYKKVGITNFLFPLEEFSIGHTAFKIDDLMNINENVFLLVNRVFDKKALDKFVLIKDKLNFVKGIFFEDIAVYQVLKNSGIDLYFNQMHGCLSLNVVNYWNNLLKGVVLSNELVKEEICDILDNTSKPLILPLFGKNMAMYSRRSLLTNYSIYNKVEINKEAVLRAGNVEFNAKENEYGTVFFYNKFFNLINEVSFFNNDKILYYYVDPVYLNSSEMLSILNGKDIDCDNRFYEKNTIYKIGDIND